MTPPFDPRPKPVMQEFMQLARTDPLFAGHFQAWAAGETYRSFEEMLVYLAVALGHQKEELMGDLLAAKRRNKS